MNLVFEARVLDDTTGETIVKVSSYSIEGLEGELYKLEKVADDYEEDIKSPSA